MTNLKDSPQLLSWYGFDEPGLNQVESGRLLYRKALEIDGYHPSMILYSSWIPAGEEFTDWCDILGTDPYWTPAGKDVRGTINYMSKIASLTKERADADRKVTWLVPMAELWSGIRKRAILPKEQFCQTYLAMIHGAKGLIYFRWPFWHQQPLETFRALAREMKVLGPIAVTPDVPQAIEYRPGAFDPKKDEYPDVQVSLRQDPKGNYVFLAANSRCCPVDATFRLSILGKTGRVKRLFSDKSCAVSKGGFSERLEPLATRAYLVGSRRPDSEPVSIIVETVARSDQADRLLAEPGFPDTGRPGKRNIVRNPGFEEASFPGWPDYMIVDTNGPRLGEPGVQADWGQDTANPFEGKACLRMKRYGLVSAGPVRSFYSVLSPQVQKATAFVLSAHMRADRDSVKVRFVGTGFGEKEFALTTSWQRYFETGVIPAGLSPYNCIGVAIPRRESATVWIDAMQLEVGTDPTPLRSLR